jgi:hypothetical protein
MDALSNTAASQARVTLASLRPLARPDSTATKPSPISLAIREPGALPIFSGGFSGVVAMAIRLR